MKDRKTGNIFNIPNLFAMVNDFRSENEFWWQHPSICQFRSTFYGIQLYAFHCSTINRGDKITALTFAGVPFPLFKTTNSPPPPPPPLLSATDGTFETHESDVQMNEYHV